MSYSGTPTLYGERQIAAAYATGTRLPVVSIAVGDGNGAAVQPTEGMTALVNEVWRGAITSWGVDPSDVRRIVVRTTIPATAGPFVVREGAIFDSAGGMIAITALATTEIVAPGTSNQATALDLTIALPIGSAGAITVSPGQGERILIERLWRTPFISINSASAATPPANPNPGDLYIVPANPQGAWATAPVGTIAEWTGTFWAFIAPPAKMVAGIMDQADDGAAEYLKWTGTAWEAFAVQGCIYTVTDNGSSTPDEFVGTTSPGLTALQPNMVFRFRQGAAANATAVPKANIVNSAGTALGDLPFTKMDTAALAAGDLPAKGDFLAEWDGTQVRVFGLRPSDVAAAAAAAAAATAATAAAQRVRQNWAKTVAGTYVYTVRAGVYEVAFRVIGAGGGGGTYAAATGAYTGACGGGGGVSEGVLQVTPGQQITVTVGAGGVGQAIGYNTAGTGGTSSLGSAASATGGSGGLGANAPSAQGGFSGYGMGGTLNYGLGDGSTGGPYGNATIGGNGCTGRGGGPGGQAATGGAAGFPGRGPGGGGGGNAAGYNGGPGADGAVYIMEL